MRIDLVALERGVALLGSGGGGRTDTAATLLRMRHAAGHDIAVTPVSELPGDALVVAVGAVGATSALTEKLPGGHEFRDAVGAVERWTGTRADAAMTIEIGGLNGLLGLVAAEQLGLPCVDADLSGRTLPRLNQFSPVAAGRELGPVAFGEPGGQVLLLDHSTPVQIERTMRAVLTLTGWGVLALAPIPARELADCAVIGSVGAAAELGRLALALAPAQLAPAVGGRLLAQGRVVEVARRVDPERPDNPGFGRGSVTVQDAAGMLLRLEMENEYLLAMRDGVVVATTPDVLAVLDRRTAVPIACEDIRHGMEVAVLQLPAPSFWTDPRHCGPVAPRAYGIDSDPVLLAGQP
ncbi:DUF917 domain-containing protein [Pseudonocardia sp. GCM10023141]|uniref:DUF917 domain-containing protein n=1 Tax=Pseudonocardia sp. GCM10023141 TaxID=3252653 RepID=UPI00360662F6